MAKNETQGRLVAVVAEFGEASGDGLTAANIGAAYAAALADFVCGKSNRKSIEQVNRLLAGCLAARRQMLLERDRLTAHRCHEFFYN